MNKLRIVIILALIMAGTSVIAQKGKILKGKLITLNGDSLTGAFTESRYSWADGLCSFYQNGSETVTVYSPVEIKGFKLEDGRLYLSRKLSIVNDTVSSFVEVLIQGSASLFYLNAKNGEYYFVEKMGVEPVIVNEPKKYIFSDDQRFVYIPDFRKRLRLILNDCEEINDDITKASCNAKNLIEITEKYNLIKYQGVITQKYGTNRMYPYLEFSIFSGLAPTRYNFGNRLLGQKGFSYQAGINIRIRNILPSNDRLSLYANVIIDRDNSYTLSKYNKGDVYGESIDYKGEQYVINSLGSWGTVPSLRVDFGLWSLKVPALFEYDILKGKTSLSLNAGFSNRIIIGRNKNFVYRWFDEENGSTFNEYYIGYAGGLSLGRKISEKNKLLFDISFEYLLDPTIMYDNQRLNSSSITFRIGYLL
jgi:hypothetical protein